MKRVKKYWVLILVLVIVVLANALVHVRVFRWDMTDDKIYSLSDATKELLRKTDAPIEVTLLLDGDLGPGFRQLRDATLETLEQMSGYTHGLHVSFLNLNTADESVLREYADFGVLPYSQEITTHSGRTEIINTFAYALIRYKGKKQLVPLFARTIGHTESEDLNTSISQLEFVFSEAIHLLRQSHIPTIAIYGGVNGVPELYTVDLERALQPYFRVKRISLNPTLMSIHVLDKFNALIIANPQSAFSDVERYIIDQYIMHGGAVLWALDGVRFSNDLLQSDGYTPIVENDLGLTEMLYDYGFQISPMLVQSRQCMGQKVNVSADPSVPNLQTLPWTFAPQLLPNPENPITASSKTLISSSLVSPISVVGGDDGIEKTSLLVTSNGTRLTQAPNEVNLGDLNPDPQSFVYRNMPIAASFEGSFTSYFAYRMIPEGVITDMPIRKKSEKTRQVAIGSGKMVMNEVEGGLPLPLGFDRVSGEQYGNRDFLINCMLWLTKMDDLIPLRAKTGTTLRPLHHDRAYNDRTKIERISTITPVAVLLFLGGVIFVIRKLKYAKKVKR